MGAATSMVEQVPTRTPQSLARIAAMAVRCRKTNPLIERRSSGSFRF